MIKEVTFKGTKMNVETKVEVGKNLSNFKATKKDLSDFNLEDYKNKVLVINTFPSVDTPVCAMQTIKFNKEAANFKDVELITISKDLPFALGRFCLDKKISNLTTLSDYRYNDFEKNCGGVIKELNLFARQVIIVNKQGQVKYYELCKEVGSEPDYSKALEALKELI